MEASTAHCHGLDWFLRQDPKSKNLHHQTLSYTLFFCFKDIEHDGLEKVCPCKSTASFGICNCWISMNFMGTNPDHGNVVIWIVVSTAAARKGNWLDTPHRSNMVTSFVAHFETHANTSVETHNFFKMRNLWQSSPLYLLYETLESINQHHRI